MSALVTQPNCYWIRVTRSAPAGRPLMSVGLHLYSYNESRCHSGSLRLCATTELPLQTNCGSRLAATRSDGLPMGTFSIPHLNRTVFLASMRSAWTHKLNDPWNH